jgi:hypothetical protein
MLGKGRLSFFFAKIPDPGVPQACLLCMPASARILEIVGGRGLRGKSARCLAGEKAAAWTALRGHAYRVPQACVLCMPASARILKIVGGRGLRGKSACCLAGEKAAAWTALRGHAYRVPQACVLCMPASARILEIVGGRGLRGKSARCLAGEKAAAWTALRGHACGIRCFDPKIRCDTNLPPTPLISRSATYPTGFWLVR